MTVGIFFLGATKLEIHLGVILPTPWTSEGVKSPGYWRVNSLKTHNMQVINCWHDPCIVYTGI